MVSTRGVKFKFSEGEKVLCYEPDPTKAKVLYNSKVLELVAGCDNHGRKIPEYLIHFSGWNSSWDRCVVEDSILPDNEENRILQRRLAEDAALQLKGKNKRKLPPLIKETLLKKELTESKKESDDSEKMDSQDYDSDSESTEEEVERPSEIEIPQPLKKQLEEDYFGITKRNKIVKIPCESNVVSILESYVKYLAANLLGAAPPKNSKIRNESYIPEDVKSKLDFCKEVMDGIRVYFDFTLPHMLLYHQEQKQYYTVGTICKPIGAIKREAQKSQNESSANDTKGSTDENSQCGTDGIKAANSASPQVCSTPPVTAPTRGRPSLRNSSQNAKHATPNDEVLINGSSSSTPTNKNRGRGRLQQAKENRIGMIGPKRVLRSADKQKTELPSVATDSNKKINMDREINSPARSDSPVLNNSTAPIPVKEAPISSSQHSSFPMSTIPTFTHPNHHHHPPSSLNMSITNSICSSVSSTRSSLSSPRFDYPPYSALNASGLLSEILSWNMLPSYVYEEIPAPPSLIYGAQHLLRLFVKLPGLIYKMKIPKKKLLPLMNSLTDFLNYMSEKREEIFLLSAYVDANESFLEKNSCAN